MEEEQFRASIQELFQSIRFVLSLDSRSSENLVFTQVRRLSRPLAARRRDGFAQRVLCERLCM